MQRQRSLIKELWSYGRVWTFLDTKTKAIGRAGIYHQLGIVAQEQRQWQQAEEYYQKALEIYIEFKDRYKQAGTYHQLGIVAQEQRQWQQAEEYYQKALEIYIEFEDRYSQASTYHNLGIVAQEQRKWHQAEDTTRRLLRSKSSSRIAIARPAPTANLVYWLKSKDVGCCQRKSVENPTDFRRARRRKQEQNRS